MQDTLKHVTFQNRRNPHAGFDMLRLEEVFRRTVMDYDLHLVEFYLILLVEDGHGTHTIDFTEYSCERGSLLTIRKDQIQRFHKSLSIKGSLLLFTDEFLISYLEQLEAQKSLQLFNEILGVQKLQLAQPELMEITELIARLHKEYFTVNDEYSLGIIRSELQILLAKLYRIKSRNSQTISDRKYLNEFIAFQQLVEQHATQTTRVKEYAKMLGISSKTLTTITRSIVHKSAKEFIDEICTKQIKRLLINTELSVKEIAYASGFEETTNFYKYFKRQTELTPEQFRSSFH